MVNKVELALIRLNYRQVLYQGELYEGYVILDPLLDKIIMDNGRSTAVTQKLLALLFMFLNAKVG